MSTVEKSIEFPALTESLDTDKYTNSLCFIPGTTYDAYGDDELGIFDECAISYNQANYHMQVDYVDQSYYRVIMNSDGIPSFSLD